MKAFLFRLPRSLPIRLVALSLACLLLGNCSLLNTAVKLGMLKLRFGCLVEGTRIDTPSGATAVENLQVGDLVVGYEGEPVEVLQVHEYLEDPAEMRHLSVRFSDGTEIQLSGRHRINGVPAGSLKVGDRIRGRVVSAVEPLGGVSRSFDLLTEDQGYRIGRIPVNSMIEEMAEQ